MANNVVVTQPRDLLRLNVGFILRESAGFTRDFTFDFPQVRIPPDLELNDLTGRVRITRTGKGLLVQVQLKASAVAECSRCLVEFQQPLEIEFTELYAFNANSVTDSGLILPETGKIDLAPLVREEMLLSMPMSPLCQVDCLGLCPVCGENLNEDHHQHEDEPIDPRLEALKTLLDKDD